MKFYKLFVLLAAAFSVASAERLIVNDNAFQHVEAMKQLGKLDLYGFSFNDCGRKSAQLHGNFSISPTDPISIPGTFTISYNATLGVTLKSPLRAVVELRRKVWWWMIKLPCILDVGSCTYDDICELIPPTPPSGCSPIFKDAGLACSCPFNEGSYQLSPTEDYIDLSSLRIPSFIVNGHYEAKVKLYDGSTELACSSLRFTLKLD